MSNKGTSSFGMWYVEDVEIYLQNILRVTKWQVHRITADLFQRCLNLKVAYVIMIYEINIYRKMPRIATSVTSHKYTLRHVKVQV